MSCEAWKGRESISLPPPLAAADAIKDTPSTPPENEKALPRQNVKEVLESSESASEGDGLNVEQTFEIKDKASSNLTDENTTSSVVHDDETKNMEQSSTAETPLDDVNEPVPIKHDTLSDEELIELAENHFQEDRLLDAARVLRTVQRKELLQETHTAILQKAAHYEATVVDLISSIESKEWTKQGESHGNRDFIVYYKVDDALRLTARIETPIEQSLLVPLMSVFNETELYPTWMPQFSHPIKMGVNQCVKLFQSGRANQIVAITADMPWPMATREAIIDATAIDDIDTNGHVIVKMETRYEGEEGGLIPPPEKGVVRIDFDGGILFRKCPEDHPALLHSKHLEHEASFILVCLTMSVDSHLKYVPQHLINFCTRTAIGRMWAMLLHVAEGIRDGERPLHAEAIAAKREVLYDWVDYRIQIMLDSIEESKLAAS